MKSVKKRGLTIKGAICSVSCTLLGAFRVASTNCFRELLFVLNRNFISRPLCRRRCGLGCATHATPPGRGPVGPRSSGRHGNTEIVGAEQSELQLAA